MWSSAEIEGAGKRPEMRTAAISSGSSTATRSTWADAATLVSSTLFSQGSPLLLSDGRHVQSLANDQFILVRLRQQT